MKTTSLEQPLGYLWIVACLAALLLSSCSSGPSESDGRKFLENYYARQNYARVKSFSKTNGIEKPNGYFLEFESDLECLRDVKLEPGDIKLVDNFGFWCGKAGAVEKINGSIRFEKTENGWRALEGSRTTP